MRPTIPPVHAGKLLLEEFMRPLGLTQYRLAKATGLSPIHVSLLVRGLRSITPETAMRLGMFFSMSPEFWMNAQAHYDLTLAKAKLSNALSREITPFTYVNA